MKVFVLQEGECFISEVTCNDIRSCLSILKIQHGDEFVANIVNNDYKFVLSRNDEKDSFVALMPEVVLSDFSNYTHFYIIKDINGEIQAPFVAAAIWGAAAGSAVAAGTATMAVTIASYAIAAIANLAISFAFSAIMNALSPTPEFGGDPSSAQQNTSNLFNGGIASAEAGGSVPFIFGNPFCSGIVISSGAYTEEA